jgi:4-hydroxy-tetrahydrodipicolinate synthase
MGDLNYNHIKGVVVPMITPFDRDENIDVKALKKLTNYLIMNGVHGIFIFGTSGEFTRLYEEQKELIAKTVIDETRGRVPLYFGVSGGGTRMVLNNIRKAEEWGADVIVCTLPYYYTLRSRYEQLSFYESVTGSTNLPIILYNIPDNVGCNILPDVIEKIYLKDNVAGIKDSSGSEDYLKEIMSLREKEFKIFIGSETLIIYGLMRGAHGLVPSIGNVFPGMTVELYNACMNKDMERAMSIQKKIDDINQLNKAIKSTLGVIFLRKYLLNMIGICLNKCLTIGISFKSVSLFIKSYICFLDNNLPGLASGQPSSLYTISIPYNAGMSITP